MITPILLYGTEVGGCENVDIIDQFYSKFCKSFLDVKQTTPSVMIYGDVGTTPLHLKIKSKLYKLYQLMHYLHENDLFHSDWIKNST